MNSRCSNICGQMKEQVVKAVVELSVERFSTFGNEDIGKRVLAGAMAGFALRKLMERGPGGGGGEEEQGAGREEEEEGGENPHVVRPSTYQGCARCLGIFVHVAATTAMRLNIILNLRVR